MNIRRLAVAAVCMLTAAGASSKYAPDFSLKSAGGKTISLSGYRGKVVMVNFWSTYCGGCVRELPWLIEMDSKYRLRGLATIGVSLDEGWNELRPFLRQNRIPYPVVLGDEAVATAYGVDAIPVTVLVDRRGRIAWSHLGVVSKKTLEAKIREALAR